MENVELAEFKAPYGSIEDVTDKYIVGYDPYLPPSEKPRFTIFKNGEIVGGDEISDSDCVVENLGTHNVSQIIARYSSRMTDEQIEYLK